MKTDYTLTDSGARRKFGTGAVRDVAKGKGRFDLITPVATARVAGVYERGAIKYEDRNWEQGMPMGCALDSAKRHINDYELICLFKREGISLDKLPANVNPEEDHLAQAYWNLAALMHMEEVRPDMDNLTKKAEGWGKGRRK